MIKFLQRFWETFWDILRLLFGVSTLVVGVLTQFVMGIIGIAIIMGLFFALLI